MAQVNIHIDDTLKAQGDELFNSLGLSFSAAVSAFVSQAIREGGMPKPDPFYSESNMRVLRQSIREAEEGKFITKTMDELLAMEDEN
ncbi:MAG: type II toxin-antitoxin system RelB/DinJ family antitoxin [Gracilibacteraceae bacterium]|nr:type II toxin-antitoxin system RelB/DinJ family antitoxin [Gracilibacteraceae bacterium]